jgi:hypothetical protein
VLDDRQSAVIGVADLGSFVEAKIAGGAAAPAGEMLDQLQRLAQLRDLAAGIAGRRRGWKRRLVRHGAPS